MTFNDVLYTISVNPNTKCVTVDRFKTVTILSINRTEKQNAMNESLLRELASHLTKFEEDSSSSVVVINGMGGNFSAGYDIDELKERSTCDNSNAVRSSLIVCFLLNTLNTSIPTFQSEFMFDIFYL